MSTHASPSPAPAYAQQRWGVFGMGVTGVSLARHLIAGGARVRCVDTRAEPAGRHSLAALNDHIDWRCGELDAAVLLDCDSIAVSPGVPLDHPALRAAAQRHIPLVGDIELFARRARAPSVGITGSNGKSTVTTLVWQILEAAGFAVRAGGNLGTPALDLLGAPEPDYYVLELSSFQLDLTLQLDAAVACVLNVSPDHLDRHGTLAHYAAAKARILPGARDIVLNADDPVVAAMAPTGAAVRWFGEARENAHYHLAQREGERWLCCGDEALMPAHAIGIAGFHNEMNALAAFAITDALGVPRDAQCAALTAFEGLPHRCRRVGMRDGVEWFDDSKATNIGAAAAAISGLLRHRAGVLIAGGQGKGADFRELRPAIAGRVHTLVLLGEDAALLEQALGDLARVERATTMPEAVRLAAAAAQSGDAVLLSPACASYDMFEGYAHRGRLFTAAVQEWLAA